MSTSPADPDEAQFMPDWHTRTLKGEFQTYLARGEGKLPLGRLLKTARTYVGKGHISRTRLGSLLGEVESETVDDFREHPAYAERKARFDGLRAGLFDIVERE